MRGCLIAQEITDDRLGVIMMLRDTVWTSEVAVLPFLSSILLYIPRLYSVLIYRAMTQGYDPLPPRHSHIEGTLSCIGHPEPEN